MVKDHVKSLTLTPKNQHLQDLFNDAFVEKHNIMLKTCTLIIGMHPDQATEDIVDVAIRHQKPFAIVPCCVFPKNGQSMPLDKWYEHLKQKTPCMEETFLNFQGRNQVLYVRNYSVGSGGENTIGTSK